MNVSSAVAALMMIAALGMMADVLLELPKAVSTGVWVLFSISWFAFAAHKLIENRAENRTKHESP